MSSTFQTDDITQARDRGVEIERLERQLEILRQPPPPIRLERPCLAGDGIKALETGPREVDSIWRSTELQAVQFIPASGAATRMFAFLPSRRGAGAVDLEEIERRSAAGDTNAIGTLDLLAHLHQLPFFTQLATIVEARTGESIDSTVRSDPGLILELLADDGLALLNRPKGLVPFHRYDENARTAFEEHLRAAVPYLSDGSSPARFHLTVAGDHEQLFRQEGARVVPALTRQLGVDIEIDYSLQDPSTDTIACHLQGLPVRRPDGRLLFRPGGHGSLLVNLSRLARAGHGIAFIKNIDNVAMASRHLTLVFWKRALAAHLLQLRQRSFALLDHLASDPNDEAILDLGEAFLRHELTLEMPAAVADSPAEYRAAFLRQRLDRPLRVCGVVINRGEPGGGPFWVRRTDGSVDGQIVESSQIDRSSPDQRQALASASHFNPVDIVCSLLDRNSQPYDLSRFVDPSTYFIASKEIGGRTVKVLERPGLWNGSMAGWNTAFVEVPEETFTPVKTLLDLLRPEHQPSSR